MADVNGDGRADIVTWLDGTHVKVHLSTGTGFDIQTWTAALYNGPRNWVADVNGDGRADIVSWRNGSAKVHLSTGTGFDIQTWTAALDINRNYVVDVNGDGKADIVTRLNGSSVKVHLSTGSSFDIQTWAGNLDDGAPARPRLNFVADVNGDGKGDIVSWLNSSSAKVHLSTGSSFDIQTWTSALDNGDTETDPNTGNKVLVRAPINLVGDFNGDNKTDIVSWRSGTQIRLHLSTGTGFNIEVSTANLNKNGFNYVGDVNGDNYSDIVSRNGDNACFIHVSRAVGFNVENWTCSLEKDSGRNYPGDFTGDGRMSIIRRAGASASTAHLIPGPIADLLTSITNNLGDKVDIAYKPITDNTVYTKENNAVYPQMDLQAAVYVVDSHTESARSDGTGQNFSFTHDYVGAKFDHLGRGGLGFHSMTTLDVSAGVQTVNTFLQDFPFTGLPDLSQRKDSAGNLFAQVKNNYVLPAFQTQATQPKVVFPALTRVIKDECNGETPAMCLQTAVTYEYDDDAAMKAFGNLTRTFHEGDVSVTGDESNERTEWVFNATGINWLHRPKRTRVLAANDTTVLREKWLYYDELAYGSPPTRGLLTKEENRTFAAPDPRGNRESGQNSTITHTYDLVFGNRESTTDPIGCTAKTTFDFTNTFPETVTKCFIQNPAPEDAHLVQTKRFTTDPRFGAKTSETAPYLNESDPKQTTTSEFDAFGRPTKITGPLDINSAFGSVSYFYPDLGDPRNQRIQSLTTKDHNTATVISREEFFDGLGRFYKSEYDGPSDPSTGTPRKIVEESTFDSRGLITSNIPPRFKTIETALPATLFSYDVLGRRIMITHPDRIRFSTMDYSIPGQVTRTDENGHEKHKFLDAYGRVEEIHEINLVNNVEETYKTFYSYDAVGSLTQVRQIGKGDLNLVTTMTYDPLGRKMEIVDPNMGRITYTYDNAGNLLTQIDPNLRAQGPGKQLSMEYDKQSRVTKKIFPNGNQITWTYDLSDLPDENFPVGRLTKVIDLAAETRFVYDKMGRVTKTERKIDGTPYVMSQQYNALSKVRNETFPDSDSVDYTYDEAGWLSAISGYLDGTTCFPRCISYNARGQSDELRYNNGVKTIFDYYDPNPPPNGQFINFALQNRTTTGPGAPSGNLQSLSYKYDKVTNVTSVNDATFTATRDPLIYDNLNRLTGASGTFGNNQAPTNCTYSYDPVGNIVNKCGVTYFYNDPNHPSFVTATSDGRTYTADLNGNTATGAGRTFAWTADNFPSSLTNASGATGMDYDYAGARVKKNGFLGLTLYPFSGYEIEPDGTKTKYFRAGNEILASKQVTTTSDPEQLFYHNDHLSGINVITDKNGVRIQLTEYDPWGKISRNEPPDNSVDPSRRFTGQIFDIESDLYYYGARYYDPDLARFVSPDSVVPDPYRPKHLNRYSYALNNPVKVTDPTGHEGEGGESAASEAVDVVAAEVSETPASASGESDSKDPLVGQGGSARSISEGYGQNTQKTPFDTVEPVSNPTAQNDASGTDLNQRKQPAQLATIETGGSGDSSRGSTSRGGLFQRIQADDEGGGGAFWGLGVRMWRGMTLRFPRAPQYEIADRVKDQLKDTRMHGLTGKMTTDHLQLLLNSSRGIRVYNTASGHYQAFYNFPGMEPGHLLRISVAGNSPTPRIISYGPEKAQTVLNRIQNGQYIGFLRE